MEVLKCVSAALVIAQLQYAWAENEHTVDLIDDTKNYSLPMSKADAEEAARIGKVLDDLFATCGRYPTTKEGLKSLVSKPKSLRCKNWGISTNNGRKAYMDSAPKGWRYNSENGSSYNIEPSK